VTNKLKKKLFFLSGLPRSGSTVLAAILNQHPKIYVSTTSGLGAALDFLVTGWHREPLLEKNDPKRHKLANAMRGLIDGYYDEITNKPLIVDKSRNWPLPVVASSMGQVLEEKPKIIATVRSIPDCMASFVRVAKPDNLDEFIVKSSLAAHLKTSYQVLQAGYKHDPSCFLFVEYEDLLANPKHELERIHKFLDLPEFSYDFERIDGSSVKEDDEGLHGVAGLHDIKPKLARQHNESPKDVLKHHYAQFCQPEFWLPEPRTKLEMDDLDLQLAASTMGDFKEGRHIADKLAIERPNDDRAAYNRGWYELHDGNFHLGHQLLRRGRNVGVFGNSKPNTPQPEWDGKSCATLLMYLEGGLGDQIQQLGYIRHVRQTGTADIVVSCSGELVKFVHDANLCSAVVQHGAEYGIYHDAWMAGMSAPVYMNLSKEMIYGDPYISKIPYLGYSKKLRVGLRWSGNKQFEAQHHKLFPAPLFFDAVKRDNVEFISLQRDADLEYKPDWVQTVPLDTWSDTQAAVSTCDLVISSCTSVSHLSAAMGVPTWVVIPVMGYYLYAEPGPKTPYYNSMRLFRQQKYGDWSHPFDEIKALNYEHELLSGRE
jgi:sulfotransferase